MFTLVHSSLYLLALLQHCMLITATIALILAFSYTLTTRKCGLLIKTLIIVVLSLYFGQWLVVNV